jgi:hypothetical protein
MNNESIIEDDIIIPMDLDEESAEIIYDSDYISSPSPSPPVSVPNTTPVLSSVSIPLPLERQVAEGFGMSRIMSNTEFQEQYISERNSDNVSSQILSRNPCLEIPDSYSLSPLNPDGSRTETNEELARRNAWRLIAERQVVGRALRTSPSHQVSRISHTESLHPSDDVTRQIYNSLREVPSLIDFSINLDNNLPIEILDSDDDVSELVETSDASNYGSSEARLLTPSSYSVMTSSEYHRERLQSAYLITSGTLYGQMGSRNPYIHNNNNNSSNSNNEHLSEQ